MKIVSSILWFLVKLPFKLLAAIVLVLITMAGIAVNLISNMSGLLIGLFNIFLMLGAFGIVLAKDWHMLWSIGAIVLTETILFFGIGIVQGIIEVIKNRLASFAFEMV